MELYISHNVFYYTEKNICLNLPKYLETQDKFLKRPTFSDNSYLLGFLL